MPAAHEFVPNFEAFGDPPPANSVEQDDPWGFNEPQPAKKETTVTSKKKKKSKKDARKIKVEDGEESSAYPKSITPSPPKEHGDRPQLAVPEMVNNQVASVEAELEPAPPPPPLVALVDEEEPVAAEDEMLPRPAPTPRPIPKPLPSVSSNPIVRSPRPAAVLPVAPATPPTRPVSLQNGPPRDRNNSLTAGYRPPPPHVQQTYTRRESFASQRPRFVEPPPPHMPQAHFFGLPDLGFNFKQKQETGRPAGSDGYCCRIDSLADAGDDASAKKARDALLVGSEGGLEVFRILPNKLEVIGRLEGLRGSIIDAKVLPHMFRSDELQPLRPLITVIVHGPMLDDRADSGAEADERELTETEPPLHFQTSVEVYSLQTQHYIATLYRSAPVPIEQSIAGHLSTFPDPVGDLFLDASGQYISLSSGKSGEVFVFTQEPYAGVADTRFRCIGKFWTSVQRPLTSPGQRPLSSGESATNLEEAKQDPQRPIYSLSQRWLAINPPFTSSNISIQGVPLLSNVNPSPPGIASHAAPPQPVITCEVVGTDTEGTWSRLGRQAAQGLVKYSQKGIEMGLQGWKELTHPSPPGGRPGHDRSSSKEDLFPPTKGPSDDPQRLAREPAIVSFIDLDSLLYWEEHRPKYLPPPLGTFALVEGCNFLSISATGTRLLTTSRKGEVSTVWDLTQLAHGVSLKEPAPAEDASSSPCIQQLQRIARNSPSTVLDCAWSRDDGALALLTAHGTIHLHEVRLRPLSRKRKRAQAGAAPALDKADATVSLSAGMSPPSANQGFLGSIKSSWQTVSTQVNSIRSTNPAAAFGLPTTFAGFREATAAASNAGSRAVARGISQGYTAAKGGASDYWHADDNKIRHTKALQEPLSAKTIRWVQRNGQMAVAVACGGSVHVHPVQRVTRRKGDAIVSGLKHERYAHKAFPLPPISARKEGSSRQALKPDACLGQGPHGFWSLRNPTPPLTKERKTSWQQAKQPRTQANDVETNAPYCPFHAESNIGVLAYEEYASTSQYDLSPGFERFHDNGHGDEEQSWAFGESIPASTKVNERVPDDMLLDGDEDDESDENVASQMESKLTIEPGKKHQGGGQIRINTTRRRQGRGYEGAAEGEFDLLDEDESII